MPDQNGCITPHPYSNPGSSKEGSHCYKLRSNSMHSHMPRRHYMPPQPRFPRCNNYLQQHWQKNLKCTRSHRYNYHPILSSRICWNSHYTKLYKHYTDRFPHRQRNSQSWNLYSNCMFRSPAGPQQDNRMRPHHCSSHRRTCQKLQDTHCRYQSLHQHSCN